MLLSQLLRRPLSSWGLALALAILALALPAGARADGRWLLVSDIHLDPFDRSALPATPGNDTNPALLRSAIAKMRAADTDPAVVVLAGDFLAHRFDDLAKRGAPHATEQATALNAMASIEREFAAAFPHARFLVALGNNDDPCGDYRVSYDSSYLRAGKDLGAAGRSRRCGTELRARFWGRRRVPGRFADCRLASSRRELGLLVAVLRRCVLVGCPTR
jgi:hypothetical protein